MTPSGATSATAATVSGSKSAPITAALSSTVRVTPVTRRSSSASAADTARGTPGRAARPSASAVGTSARCAPGARGRTGSRRSPGTAARAWTPADRPPSSAEAVSASSGASRTLTVRPSRSARSTAATSRSDACRWRNASASMTSAAGGRRRSAAIRSIEDGSAQCRSSRTTTSGASARALRAASASRRAGGGARRRGPCPPSARAPGRTLDSAASSARLSVRAGMAGHVRVEGVHPRRERQVGLVLGGAAGEDEPAARTSALGQFRQQPALADPRFAADDDAGEPPAHRSPRPRPSGRALPRVRGAGSTPADPTRMCRGTP